ncbi:MAG: methyl-accepting chemotaxis protein [Oceanospirillaceae bacterium]
MFSNIKIATKIYAFAGLMLACIVLLGTVSLLQMQKIGVELIDVAEEDIPITNALTQITINQLEQAVLFERGVGVTLNEELAKRQNISEILAKFTKIANKTERLIKQTEQIVEQAIEHSHTAAAKTEFTNLLATLKNVEREHLEFDRRAIAALSSASNISSTALIDEAKDISEIEEKIDHELIEALTHVQQFTLDATMQAEEDEKYGQKLILIIFIITALTTIILAVIIAKAIITPVNNLRDSLIALVGADANLNVQLTQTKDEVGEAAAAFNELMSKLRKMIVHITMTSNHLDSQSSEAIDMMGNALIGIEQQQQQTQSVADAISEMADSIQEVSQSTTRAAELGSQVKSHVTSSMDVAQQSKAIIESLSTNVSSAAVEIESLSNETDRIGVVLNSIRGIAEQTNLLALNAAIEAARAGESGRGFAVVADEVRALAQRTQTSTQDIQDLLQSLQQEVAKAVATMEQGQGNAVSCLEKAILTTNTLNEATEAVLEIAALNTQIAAAAEQQAGAAHEVCLNLQGITEKSADTTQSTRETAKVSKDISDGLRGLSEYVGQLKT